MTVSIPKPPEDQSTSRPRWAMGGRRSAAPQKAASGAKSPVLVLATMGAIAGMFGVLALPAYAANTTEEQVLSVAAEGQSLVVDDDVTLTVASRDSFQATTPEALAAQRAEEAAAAAAAAAMAARVASFAASGPRAGGDDYPWFGGSGLSPLNYYAGECVDFVAWRLNRDAGVGAGGPFPYTWATLTPGGGSAVSWTNAWYNAGRIVSNIPVPGAVAVTQYDHVAYVNSVNADGTVNIEEYNYGNRHAYNARTIPASSVLAFLYPPG